MQYTDSQIDAMLAPPMGKSFTFFDGSKNGVSLNGKFKREVTQENLVTGEVVVADPILKVRYSAINGWVKSGEDGTVISDGEEYFQVRDVIRTDSGFAILTLAEYEAA